LRDDDHRDVTLQTAEHHTLPLRCLREPIAQ